MDARKLVDAAAAAGYAPYGTIDGKILTRQIIDTFDRGEQAPVPLIAGFNTARSAACASCCRPCPPTRQAMSVTSGRAMATPR